MLVTVLWLQVELLLTSCHNYEYTCNDGMCIDKSRRCDLSVDCDDQSDEMDCSVVVVPEGYSAQLPPPTYRATPLPILFSLNITSVRQFDLVSFTIAIDVYMRMTWKDRRLKYKNLQANFRANKLEEWREVRPLGKTKEKRKNGPKANMEAGGFSVYKNLMVNLRGRKIREWTCVWLLDRAKRQGKARAKRKDGALLKRQSDHGCRDWCLRYNVLSFLFSVVYIRGRRSRVI